MLLPALNSEYPKRMKKIPNGLSVTQAVKAGMDQHPKRSDLAAAVAGMDQRNYRFIRKLLLLSEQNLPTADKESINSALSDINKELMVAKAIKLVGPIVDKYWLRRKESSFAVSQRRLRFDKTVMNIDVTCESASELKIPRELSQSDLNKAIASLSSSLQHIGNLISRLAGETTE